MDKGVTELSAFTELIAFIVGDMTRNHQTTVDMATQLLERNRALQAELDYWKDRALCYEQGLALLGLRQD